MRIKDPKIAWLLLYVFVNVVATIIMLTTGQLIGDAAGNRVYDTDILLLASFLVIFSLAKHLRHIIKDYFAKNQHR